jgi:ligand-binding sensor domain-containing protein
MHPPERFKTILDKALGNAPYGMSIRGITKSGRNKLFIATELDGLYELNLPANTLTRPGDRLPQLAPLNQFIYIRNLLPQGDSVLWIPGREGVLKYVPARHELRLYRVDTTVTGKNEVWGVALGKAGALWVCTMESGLHLFDPRKGKVTAIYSRENGLRN